MRLYFLLALAALLSVLTPAGAANAPAPGPAIGQPAPTFALPDTSGKLVNLSAFRGQPVVLNFWAFWCDTWKAELPGLRELATRQSEMNFRLVALSVDGTRLSVFNDHTHGGAVPFPVLMDFGGSVSAEYHVRHVPTVVILDSNGIVRYAAVTYPGNAVVLSEIRKIESEAQLP